MWGKSHSLLSPPWEPQKVDIRFRRAEEKKGVSWFWSRRRFRGCETKSCERISYPWYCLVVATGARPEPTGRIPPYSKYA